MNGGLQRRMEQAHFRKKREGDVSCALCKHHKTKILDPTDENSERDFYCTYFECGFGKDYRPVSFCCDSFEDDPVIMAGFQAFAKTASYQEQESPSKQLNMTRKKGFFTRFFGK